MLFIAPSLVIAIRAGMTLFFTPIIEICSEGSVLIVADLHTRAQAPGNGFAFLMRGVAMDYTEIMLLNQTTRSCIVALMLPLTILPQPVVIAFALNT